MRWYRVSSVPGDAGGYVRVGMLGRWADFLDQVRQNS
jgi:hypothetical protein